MNKMKFYSIFLIFFGASIVPVISQEIMVAKLTESELKIVLPIIKEEVTGYGKQVKDYASERDSRYQLLLDIKSGKIDPLEWLKQHSRHILVPPDAKYEPACSKAASLGIFAILSESELAESKPGVTPTAIFTLGKEIRSIDKKVLGQNITMESHEKFFKQVLSISEQDYAEIKSIIDRVISFYSKNGFYARYGTLEDGESRTTAIFYHPDDEGYISGTIYHLDSKLYDPNYSEATIQCWLQHPAGPSIEIKAEDKLLDKVFSTSGSGENINENVIRSLQKAGISRERYDLIKLSLIRARADSENPDAIEVPEIDFVPTTDEEKEIAKTINQMKADALARKNNIVIYNKFKNEVDPILDILQQFMY